jgi:hypothetical protein
MLRYFITSFSKELNACQLRFSVNYESRTWRLKLSRWHFNQMSIVMAHFGGTWWWHILAVQCDGTFWRYMVVTHFGGTVWWHILAVQGGDTFWRYSVVTHFGGTVWWHILAVQCGGTFWRYNVVAHFGGTAWWHILAVQCGDTFWRYSVVAHFGDTVSCRMFHWVAPLVFKDLHLFVVRQSERWRKLADAFNIR